MNELIWKYVRDKAPFWKSWKYKNTPERFMRLIPIQSEFLPECTRWLFSDSEVGLSIRFNRITYSAAWPCVAAELNEFLLFRKLSGFEKYRRRSLKGRIASNV